ncbi:MAG: bifunctional indole-3-glycerol phosphate synthase/phosphoribosylanthranilate isomerase, partial [Chloroflexi bacterium]|nr:bifunctional indole-3-glycerol phosphate synthase/phosphoribosylanthranilate isomerase [Chloroflexota bacterium]
MSRRPVPARPNVLAEIVERRRADLPQELAAAVKRRGPVPSADRSAVDALGPLARPGLHLIAEIKRRSPSAGRLARDPDIVARARAYEQGGASVISVLVEPHYFGGSLEDLAAVRRAVAVPLLAKEFVVDARQFEPLQRAGADLVLLIASVHAGRALGLLVAQARDAGLEPLVEAHDRRQLERALGTDARLVGVNNRDLRTLEMDPERAQRLRVLIPDDRLAVVESGLRSPDDLAGLLALGFDAALVGEALMRAGDEPREVAARCRAFVAAGRPQSDVEDLAGAARRPAVKLCGITDARGAMAALAAGADAIGLNFVPGTKRCLSVEEGVALATLIRDARGDRAQPMVVGVFADQPVADVERVVNAAGLERVQLAGSESVTEVAAFAMPVLKVLHVGAATDDDLVAATIERGRAFLALPNVVGLMLDSHDRTVQGGTGRRIDAAVARRVALELPVWLAGGLDPSNVADALRSIPAVGVDVASGIEAAVVQGSARGLAGRPVKD